ncbi:NUDIX hydrolase [Agaricicola taiwanensis]|uniref:NUDIX hydrolase n=1 Tax=Agaricicola taiwanensis TaxID=591372 RepID=A0A8J3DWQ9_9RHOB|nr:NUDIX hydrolase [Agaricicola taiwanensis]GGE47240.1 NUDIX hydrolase [Agaricicola taiwanensis]
MTTTGFAPDPTSLAPAKTSRLRPRDAATIILLDTSGSEPLVLMGRRHDGHVFMPGKYVFPGGRVEAGDGRMNICGNFAEHIEEQLMARVSRPSYTRVRAYGLAAIRELAEETGLLFGFKDAGIPPAPTPEWEPFARAGVFPTLEGLSFIARAITPPGRTRRYDTRFFAANADYVADRIEGIVGPDAELTELVWVTLPAARSLDLPRITGVVLGELEKRLEAGIDRVQPVPFFFFRSGRSQREEL